MLSDKDRQLSELNRELKAGEADLFDARQQVTHAERELAETDRELEQRYEDLRLLAHWVDVLLQQVSALLGSQRWKIGNFSGELLRKLLRKPQVPTAVDSINEVDNNFHAWKQRRGGKQLAPGGRRRQDLPESASDGVVYPQATQRRPGGARTTKISVLAWDVTHNPMGRAYLIADVLSRKFDVEVVGAKFPRYGDKVWGPVSNGEIPTTDFPGWSFPAHFSKMEEIAANVDGDVILVSKPRLPSYELGILAKQFKNRPLILDVDDHEASFFDTKSGLTLEEVQKHRGEEDFLTPYGKTWTRYCENIISCADHVTVSNEELQKRYGGTIFPHAKDETRFDPALYDRDAVRVRYGFAPDDKVILFIGTPRLHKGVAEIAEALERIGNPNYKLCIIGTVTEPRLRERLDRVSDDYVRVIPNQTYANLPENLCIGDLVCILQDPNSEIAKYQMPSKFTDALAMEIPILATDVPPLANLASSGLVELLDTDSLSEKIEEIFSDYEAYKQRAVENRETFLAEYSYAATADKIEGVVRPLFKRTLPVPAEFKELLEFHRGEFVPAPGHGVVEGAAEPSALKTASQLQPAAAPVDSSANGLASGRRREAKRYVDDKYDIVVFWRQNDTGIYGRRQDMLVKYLAASPRINQIIHFDAPTDVYTLRALFSLKEDHKTNQSNYIFLQTISRLLGLKSFGKIKGYTFAFIPKRRPGGKLLQRLFPRQDEHVQYIRSVLEKNDIGERKTIFWVYPTNFNFGEIARAFNPDFVVADVVDDLRTFSEPESPRVARITRNYNEILGMSDLVLTNNQNMHQSMLEYSDAVHLIPNACEPPEAAGPLLGPPRELAKLSGPIIGYVGNLSSRIDIALLEHVVTARPDWNLVLIGSAHASQDILRLDAYDNVHFLGVKPHSKVQRYIKGFDVAIIPHLNNQMTKAMNPLKLFVYCSAGVPVVSTEVESLDELRSLIYTAHDREEFVKEIEAALDTGRSERLGEEQIDLLRRNSWQERVKNILDLIDQKWAEPQTSDERTGNRV